MLEQKFQKSIDETEQQRDKPKTWQHGLEETLELQIQDFIGQNKQQKEENEGVIDTGADVTIISPKSWPESWPLQEAYIQFQGVGTLSQTKESIRWLKCIGP